MGPIPSAEMASRFGVGSVEKGDKTMVYKKKVIKYTQEIWMDPCQVEGDTALVEGECIPWASDFHDGDEVAVYQFVGIKHVKNSIPIAV